MKSKARQECEEAVKQFADIINEKVNGGKLLYVGIAGDPPGGEYSPMFKGFSISTFDIGERWKPDILGDITKTTFEDDTWDVIVCVQTIEHIPNLWQLPAEITRILKPGGYAIIDSPWSYPYHGEPEFGDYWRISKDGMKALFEPHLKIVGLYDGEQNTSCLFKK
jgi:SAM-dependent methyltransferase